jgi:hypothetical protein
MEFNPAKLNPSQPEEPKPSTRQWPRRKRWKVAKNTTMGKYNAIRNMCIEDHFMKVRKAVRLLYAQHNEYFYDRDERNDLTESTVSMHSMACSTFYMILDCNHCDEYEVEYDIASSPFKEEIATLIYRGPMRNTAKQVSKEPIMEAYFQYMRTYYSDNPKHFSYLSLATEQQE